MNENNISYVVLRNYENLPEKIIGDIDLLIDDQDFQKALSELDKKTKFKKPKQDSKIIELGTKGLKQPKKALKYVLRPQDVKNLIHSTVTTNLKNDVIET